MSDTTNFNIIYSRPPNFCDDCGDLLDFEVIKNDSIKCQRCDGSILISKITNYEISTKNEYSYSKEWVDKLNMTVDTLKAKQEVVKQTIDRLCNACGHDKMFYETKQTRSADEGSTVFYECVKCGNKDTENN